MQAYFSYGSNMDVGEMRERCPGATLQGIAVLRDHRVFITEDGYATITFDRNRRVLGALWMLTEEDERALDLYEDVASGWYRKVTITVDVGGTPVEALAYVASAVNPGRPHPGYLELVIAAARQHGLPATYIMELEGLTMPPS